MSVNLKYEDMLDQGQQVQFYAYYSPSMTLLGQPSDQNIVDAVNSIGEINVLSVQRDIVKRVASFSQIEFQIQVSVNTLISVGQIQSSTYNALSSLLSGFLTGGSNLTVGSFTEISGGGTTQPNPSGNQGDSVSWLCSNLGIGCGPGILDTVNNLSNTVKFAAVAVVVVAIIYFVKGVRVGA